MKSVLSSLCFAILILFCVVSFGGEFPYSLKDRNFPREEPLRELNCSHIIKVSDYGAKVDDGICDIVCIQAAIDAAISLGEGTRLVFEKGVYDLIDVKEPKRGVQCIKVKKAKNLELAGNGATLVLHEPFNNFINIDSSENIIVRDFFAECKNDPYTYGIVLSKDGSGRNYSVDVEIFEGYKLLNESPVCDCDGSVRFINPDNPPLHAEGTYGNYVIDDIEHLGGRKFRISFSNDDDFYMRPVKVGQHFLKFARFNRAVAGIGNSNQVSFINFTIYNGNAGGFSAGQSSNYNYIDCKIIPKKGKIFSTNADAFHFGNNITGPWIENCRVEAISDDPFNSYNIGSFVTEKTALNTYKIERCFDNKNKKNIYKNLFRIGDKVSFVDGASGKLLGTRTVKNIDLKNSTVEFDGEIEGVVFGVNKRKCTSVYNISMGRGTVIIKSKFINNFRYGCFLKTDDVLIEGNLYEGQSSSAIAAFNEIGWPEGLFANNVVVRKNRFKNIGDYGWYQHDKRAAVVSFVCDKLDSSKDNAKYRKNVLIEDNLFIDWTKCAIRVENTENAIVRNNKIKRPHKRTPEDAEPIVIIE